MEPTPETTVAVCAAHEGAAATGTCARCGDNVCPACLDPDAALPDHCESCRGRVGGALLPWEQRGGRWAHRWMATLGPLIARPRRTFEGARARSWRAGLSFAATCGAVQGTLTMILVGCGLGCLSLIGDSSDIERAGRGRWSVEGMVLFTVFCPILTAAWQVATVSLRALCVHLPVALSGRGAGFGVSVAGCGYTSFVYLGALVLSLSSAVPILGSLLYLGGWLGLEIWAASLQTTMVRTQHGLTGGRAILAGWMPFLALTALSLLCCVGVLAYLLTRDYDAAG